MMDFLFLLPLVSCVMLFWFVFCSERELNQHLEIVQAISKYNNWAISKGLYWAQGIDWRKLPPRDEHLRALVLFRDIKALYKSRGIDLDMILSEDYKKSETQKIELF